MSREGQLTPTPMVTDTSSTFRHSLQESFNSSTSPVWVLPSSMAAMSTISLAELKSTNRQ